MAHGDLEEILRQLESHETVVVELPEADVVYAIVMLVYMLDGPNVRNQSMREAAHRTTAFMAERLSGEGLKALNLAGVCFVSR